MSDPEKALRAKTSKAKKRLRQSEGTAGEPPKTVCKGKADDAKLGKTVGKQPSPHRQNEYMNVTNINVTMSDERREFVQMFQGFKGEAHQTSLGEPAEEPESPDPPQDLEDWNRENQPPSPSLIPKNQDAREQLSHGSTHE